LKKGNSVYTYLNKSKPDYHGKKTVDQVKSEYEIVVGDGSYGKDEWMKYADDMYGKSFVGLFLSKFCGGGMSIQEMGLRGIPVVTNIMNLPHCYRWGTVEDIQNKIQYLSSGIGKVDKELADQVYESMVKQVDCFDLEQLLV
jgi:hypothetical protein